MRLKNNQIIYSPSDISNFIHCQHLTHLDYEAAQGKRIKPVYTNRVIEALQKRGNDFESTYLAELASQGKNIFKLSTEDADAFESTKSAMQEGYDVIYQARLGKLNEWQGWADFLVKVDKPSNLGNYSYEVIDTKLASETKAATIIQISLYTEAVVEIQGVLPEFMRVKTPLEEFFYRTDDYLAYVRLVKKRFFNALQSKNTETYPNPVAHCDVCSWWEVCNQKRREDDHLSFVAGMGNAQIKEVNAHQYPTLDAYANAESPIPFLPRRGAIPTYQKLRDQANIQWRSRNENHRPIYEILELQKDKGFFRLPEPSEHDVYLDFEGDPLVEPGGLEYLLGWYYQGEYRDKWANNEAEEKQIFEEWMDWVLALKKAQPDMHIYHYAPYETSALKRLAGKYASRGDELDELLRSNTFVDLYGVVRQSIRASVEKYSIKDLEKFFGYTREMDLREVSKHKRMYEFLLETQKVEEATEEMIAAIRLYNQDDCISTKRLHVWLENLRNECIASGQEIARPIDKGMEASEKATQHQERIQPLMDTLLMGVPEARAERNAAQEARFLLAYMLDWYRREKKSKWWEVYRLKDLTDEELLEEKAAISQLAYTGKNFVEKQSTVYEYRFSQQEIEYSSTKKILRLGEASPGTIHEIDFDRCILQIKKGRTADHTDHYSRIIFYEDIPDEVKEEAVIRFAAWVVENGLESLDDSYQAVRSLLLRELPKTHSAVLPNPDMLEFSKNWVSQLDNSYLPVQGPPGSGKSYTGTRMILNLLAQGKKVGITAMSHKVIEALVEKVWKLSKENKAPIVISQKVSQGEKREWRTFTDPKKLDSELQNANLIAGTPFLFANELADQKLDYLFIDEAGQLSLIDTIACGLAAKNIVLLGDPQQLQQPQQGIHPEGTEVSALAHILQNQQTISKEQGLFLDKTYRMHPSICAFDSEQFYENKLNAIDELERQVIVDHPVLLGAGLKYIPVAHEGNSNSSLEEKVVIESIVKQLCNGQVKHVNEKGETHLLKTSDIKIIAPYNAQVKLLKETLPEIEIGTVDKFQGQEAPVVIYSLTTSTPEEAPRGMDFLYSPNRFNVAVSRAKTLFILVASPAIFEPDCKSPSQIKLANPFCRFLEMAELVEIQ